MEVTGPFGSNRRGVVAHCPERTAKVIFSVFSNIACKYNTLDSGVIPIQLTNQSTDLYMCHKFYSYWHILILHINTVVILRTRFLSCNNCFFSIIIMKTQSRNILSVTPYVIISLYLNILSHGQITNFEKWQNVNVHQRDCVL